MVLPQLGQLLRRPIRETLIADDAQELRAIPSHYLAVAQTGAEHRAATGMGAAAKTAEGQPQLVLRLPAGFPQRVR